MKKFLLGARPAATDFACLLLRAAGSLLLFHGIPKLLNFNSISERFGDPIGIGPLASLALCVFAEFFCVIFIALGAFTRLALIPVIVNMAVIFFIVHGDEPVKERELSLIYLLIYLVLFFTGPGKYSVDGLRKA